MKNVLMILVLLGGFAITEAGGQANCNPANCAPCPPGCSIAKCCTLKGPAASAKCQKVDVAFASLLTEGWKEDQKGGKMSNKEKKACIEMCKAASTSTVSAACQPTPACKGSAVTTAFTPVARKADLPSKI